MVARALKLPTRLIGNRNAMLVTGTVRLQARLDLLSSRQIGTKLSCHGHVLQRLNN